MFPLTLVASESILEEKKGGSRQAIWYKIQPTAQMSAFSPYSMPRTTSGLKEKDFNDIINLN